MKYSLLILICLFSQRAYCQQVPILNLRYNEDYSALKYDTSKNWYKAIKYLPVKRSKSSYLSFGGEYRYQLQYLKNEDWGDAPKQEITSVYNRLLLHSDLHVGNRFRFFGQIVSTTVSGREAPLRSIDENRIDVQQVFADLHVFKSSKRTLTIRTGRQELLYGSQRLISVREGSNNRLSFDAIKTFYRDKDFQVDLFYSQPVRNRNGVFDDSMNSTEKLWSAYLVFNKVPVIHNADFYYIGYQHKNKPFLTISALENRHSVGARLWENGKGFHYDIEAVYQFGKTGKEVIDAYTASVKVTYKFNQVKFNPVVGLKTEAISGDKSATDEKLHSFNPLFPRGAYFGLAALIGPVNLVDVHPSIEFELHPNIVLAADYDIFWRHSIGDGVYGANAVMLYPAASDKHIGNQLGISIEYTPIRYLEITPEFTYFKAGKYLKEVSAGKDIVFAVISIHFKF